MRSSEVEVIVQNGFEVIVYFDEPTLTDTCGNAYLLCPPWLREHIGLENGSNMCAYE